MSSVVVPRAMPRTVPWNVALLVGAILISGFAAASVAMPELWLVTPLVAALEIYGWLSAPAPDPDADPAELPSLTRVRVRETLRALPSGDAARLLREVVRPARSLFAASRSGEPLAASSLRDCAELVDAACTTAAEMARLQGLLTRDASALHSRDQLSLRESVDGATQMLALRLTEAGVALGELYVQRVEHGTTSSDRLHELVQDLGAEVKARREATAELESLLG